MESGQVERIVQRMINCLKGKATEENYQLIRKYLKENGLSKTTDIAQAIGLSPARTRAILKEMSGLEYEGTTNNRRYRLADNN